MQNLTEYSEAIDCIKNRRYTPAASFMVEGMVRTAGHRIPIGQRRNLTRASARRLRRTHTRLLMAQNGGVALRAMAEQAYRDVEAEMAAEPGGAASATSGARQAKPTP